MISCGINYLRLPRFEPNILILIFDRMNRRGGAGVVWSLSTASVVEVQGSRSSYLLAVIVAGSIALERPLPIVKSVKTPQTAIGPAARGGCWV